MKKTIVFFFVLVVVFGLNPPTAFAQANVTGSTLVYPAIGFAGGENGLLPSLNVSAEKGYLMAGYNGDLLRFEGGLAAIPKTQEWFRIGGAFQMLGRTRFEGLPYAYEEVFMGLGPMAGFEHQASTRRALLFRGNAAILLGNISGGPKEGFGVSVNVNLRAGYWLLNLGSTHNPIWVLCGADLFASGAWGFGLSAWLSLKFH